MTARTALALFAHPDDETLACGGTLASLVERGWSVQVAIVSDGVVTARGGEQDNRSHAADACAVLGLDAPRFLGFPDQRFDTVAVSDIVNAARPLLPADLVITNASTDLNDDHRIVSHAARVLARPIDGPMALLEAEVPGGSAWNGAAFVADWYVDVSAHLSRKLKALRCYRNETRAFPHPCAPESIEALAVVHGAASGLGRAEAFHLVRGYADLLP